MFVSRLYFRDLLLSLGHTLTHEDFCFKCSYSVIIESLIVHNIRFVDKSKYTSNQIYIFTCHIVIHHITMTTNHVYIYILIIIYIVINILYIYIVYNNTIYNICNIYIYICTYIHIYIYLYIIVYTQIIWWFPRIHPFFFSPAGGVQVHHQAKPGEERGNEGWNDGGNMVLIYVFNMF